MPRVFRLSILVALLAAAATVALDSQTLRLLTVEDIYDPMTRVDFTGTPPADLQWLDASTYTFAQRTGRQYEWLQVDAATGRTTPLFEPVRMEAALTSLPGVTQDEARTLAGSSDLTFNRTHTAALVTIADDLYDYDFASGRATRLTTAAGTEEDAEFSPDGRMVAFTRNHDLFVVDVGGQEEQRLTTDGSASILNGRLDWLYQEEIFGRGDFKAFWWSPDSSRLAFIRLDEQPVPHYPVVDDVPYQPAVDMTEYPKAGDPNPVARLGIVRVAGGTPAWADTTPEATPGFLIVDVAWAPDSRGITYQIQDREQTWLDLNVADAATGAAHRVLRETTKAWVNNNGSPHWLKDGSFLWLSERSGYKHVYHYRMDGTLVRQITTGPWEVRALYGVDEASGLVYFAGLEHSAIGTDVYRIRMDGTGLTRLSKTEGTHRAIFNPTFTQYADLWSDARTPAQARLERANGTELRVIDANAVPALGQFRLSAPEFLQVKARDGVMLNAMMIKPPDFDPARRYPVYEFTYSGPGNAEVRNAWGRSEYMFEQMLAEHGVIVWVVDNRSATLNGVQWQWPIYGRLGELELQDLEDGLAWLKRQPYVDASRIVLSGWSYGGFMTTYALTHSTSWTAGIAGGSVTDWRDYDSVYTERYMKTPEHNPDGYRRTAPRFAADHLHGRLLLIHGEMDDNVHPQNTLQFAYELQKMNKPFEMMIYPRARHSPSDPRQIVHLRQMMFDFAMKAAGLQ